MGCISCAEERSEIENEFDLIWGSLKKQGLFTAQQLEKHVNGKVYFQLLFSKFLFHFYNKMIDSVEQLLACDASKIIRYVQQGLQKMKSQKQKMRKRSEGIIKKYPQIVSDLLTGRESTQKEERMKKEKNRQSNKSTTSNKSNKSNRENRELMREDTIEEGEGIECEVSQQYSYEIPGSAIDEVERKLEISNLSQIKTEGLQRINENLQFQKQKRILLEERIIVLEKQLKQVKDNCEQLNKDRQNLEERAMKAELQELKCKLMERIKSIQTLSFQNQMLISKINQLQNQVQSLKQSKAFPQKKPLTQEMQNPQQQQNDIALRSFIILDPSEQEMQQDASRNLIRGCEIIFKLFADSKLLPNHTLFQAAVGVRTIIGEMFGRPIRGSKLLYAYDKINPVSFGRYIENMNNLLIIFKLRKGSFVGGFAGKIDEVGFLQSSFLFSVRSQKEPMKLPAKRKVPKVDREPGMMMFGAGELMVKSRSLELNCNIGNLQAFYGLQKKRNVSAETFLGDSESPQPLEGYQIYQLQFHQVS